MSKFLQFIDIKKKLFFNIKLILLALMPALTAIFIGDLLLVFIFMSLGGESLSLELLIYTLIEGGFAWLLGKLSDKWNKKNVLLLIHSLALIFLLFLFYNHEHLSKYLFLAGLAGMIFVPSPAARSYIIDHYHANVLIYKSLYITETRLISISWLAQYLPWALVFVFNFFSKSQYVLFIIIMLILNVFMLLFFIKKENVKVKSDNNTSILIHFNKSKNILLAFLFAQTVFFVLFSKIEFIPQNNGLFFLVGIGAIIGTILGLFYQKTPHLSTITYTYGICFGLSLLGVLFLWVFDINSAIVIDAFVKIQIIYLGGIGGFYLPFIYDIVIQRGGANHRGRMLACLEIVQLVASLFGILLTSILQNKLTFLFFLISILFVFSIILQIKEENELNKSRKTRIQNLLKGRNSW